LLSLIDDLVQRFPNHYILCEGDFNVDFSDDRMHTNIRKDFHRITILHTTVNHDCSAVDYSYNYSMLRFSIIAHFIISEVLLEETVKRVS
jgi:hypothetical protein